MKPYIYYYKDKTKNKIIYIGKSNGQDKTYRTGSKILKRYISIYGYESFDVRFDKNVIEYCLENELDLKEEYWIKHYNTYNNGLNLTRGGKHDWKRNNYKPVLQYDLQGNFIKEWEYGKDAYNTLQLSNYDGISACCKGKQKTSEGFIWKYKTKNFPNKINIDLSFKGKGKSKNKIKGKNTRIKDNETGLIYDSIIKASISLGLFKGTIRNWLIKNKRFTYEN